MYLNFLTHIYVNMHMILQFGKYIFLRRYTAGEDCVFHLDYMLYNKSHN